MCREDMLPGTYNNFWKRFEDVQEISMLSYNRHYFEISEIFMFRDFHVLVFEISGVLCIQF